MTEEDLQSPERRAEIEKLEKENAHDSMVPKEEKSISQAFVCGRCKERKVSYTQAQTRSAVRFSFSTAKGSRGMQETLGLT